ncbi:MAG: hypothetical protein QXX30_03470 [Candidatus Aenigmatarchaeota archaeon]
MTTKKIETAPIRSFAGIFKFGKEKSKIAIDKNTLIALAIILSILVLAAHILFKYFI